MSSFHPILVPRAAAALILAAVLAGACGQDLRLDPVLPGETGSLDPEVLALAQQKIEKVRLEPANARLHGSLGLVYESNRIWDAAEKSYDNAARLDPREPLWPYHRSIALREGGRTDEADALLRSSAAQLASAPGVQHRLGQALLDAGDLTGALAAFRRALALTSDQPEVLVGIASVMVAQEDQAGAVPLLQKAIQKDPSYKQAHYLLGLAFRALSRDSEAAEQLALGLDAKVRFLDDPLSAELKSYKVNYVDQLAEAGSLMTTQQYAAALNLCERVLVKRPDDKDVLNNAGAAAMELASYDRAFELLGRAMAIDEREFATHINLAECYLRTQKLLEATQHADRAVALAPGVGRARMVRARVLASRGRFQDAYLELRQAAKLDARNAMTYVALSEVCAQLERLPEALEWCQTAVQLDPSYLPARFNLAMFTMKTGDLDRAAALTRELDRLAPGNPRVALLKQELEKLGR